MKKKNQPTKPPADDFRSTYLSTRGALVLGQHGLSLPAGHPARAMIQVLLERWAVGSPVAFGDEAEPTEDPFDGLAEVMEAA